jgi:hypothetical protein
VEDEGREKERRDRKRRQPGEARHVGEGGATQEQVGEADRLDDRSSLLREEEAGPRGDADRERDAVSAASAVTVRPLEDAAVAAKRWAGASLVEVLGRDPDARRRGERGAATIEDLGDE